MGVLKKSKHEQFAQSIAAGQTGGQAYVLVYGPAKGADQSASRLLRTAQISARIAELQARISSELLANTILDRKSRLQALENRWKMLNRVIEERGSALGGLNLNGYPLAAPKATGDDHEIDGSSSVPAPGASTGLVCLDWRGKEATRAVWKVDTGLLSEMRAIEEQAARELGQWMDKSELTVKDGDLAARLAAGRARLAKRAA